MSDAVIGKEVDGYRIQAVLGRGGMGTVYKAEDVNLSRTVAIKRINPGQQERESFIHRFRSEAQALARIDSPHIVGVYALRETDIGLLIVMEYVEGGTLKDPIDQQGALAPNQAVPILEQTLEAFHDAHTAGVIHRDIKPENVMLTKDGLVKVTDFGIAKLRQPDSGETVTQGGQGGTLKYMSPEQISDINAVDTRSDIYSLGMTAYEMLSGSLPFKESDTDFDIMRKVVEGEVPPPDEFNPEIPSGLAQWVVGAIQKQQDNRYQSAEEMLTALRDADEQVDQTMTQPEWEVDGGSSDVDETQTVVPSDEDRTETVVPGSDEGDGSSTLAGETVMGPDTPLDEGGATQPSVSKSTADTGSAETATETDFQETETNEDTNQKRSSWAVIGGVVAALLVAAGAVAAYTQWGGGAGASATLSLSTTPTGAIVLVNGDTVGTTPLSEHVLEAGAVQLQIQKDGYQSLDSAFTVKTGGRVSLDDLKLARVSTGEAAGPQTVAVNTDNGGSNSGPRPSGAEKGSDPSESRSSTVDASSTEQPSGSASQSSGGSTGDASSDSEAVGRVQVSSEPVGTVAVAGKRRGTGTLQLPPGEHTVTCRHPDGGSVQTTLSVSKGRTETLTCYTEQKVNVTTSGGGGTWGQIWLNGANTQKRTSVGKGVLSLPPGSHRIEVRRRSIDNFQVNGGQVKVERGGDSDIEKFSGTSYQVHVEPTFEKVDHVVVFNVEEGN